MHKIFMFTVLFAVCFVSGNADTRKALTVTTKPLKVNLKAHEKHIYAFHTKMTREKNELSKEFISVHQGMKKGNYTYDFETARKVMQELKSHRMQATPKFLNSNTK